MRFDAATNHPIWPLRSAGPHSPSRPLTNPFLRLIPGVPRFGRHSLEWLVDRLKPTTGRKVKLSAELTRSTAVKLNGRTVDEAVLTLRGNTELRYRFDFNLPCPSENDKSSHIRFSVLVDDVVTCVGSVLVTDIPLDAGIMHCTLFSPGPPFLPVAKLHFTYLHITAHETAPKFARAVTPRFAPRFIGHRGMGSSGPHAPHRPAENSVASFLHAAHTTNDLVRTVELDVQLTKDDKCVVHHDWFFYPLDKNGDEVYEKTSVRTPVHSLTFSQLESLLRTSPYYQRMLTNPPDNKYDQKNHPNYTLLANKQSFKHQSTTLAKTLRDVCQSLPTSVDILVELKYPSPDLHEFYQLPFPRRDHFVNVVLDDLFSTINCTKRNIAFLCFEPDICDMLRLKQSTFPVYLSHCATVDKPCDEFDPRTISPHVGFEFVKNYDLNGLMMYNKLVFLHPSLIEKIVEEDYPILTYGTRNSDPSVVKSQFAVGVSGVIADDIHEMIDRL